MMLFHMAKTLGRTVGELERDMTWRELQEWSAFLRMGQRKPAMSPEQMIQRMKQTHRGFTHGR